MALKDNKLLDVQEIQIKIPGKPRLFPFVTCADCGEAFMEPWARINEGRVLCKACSHTGLAKEV